MPVHTLRSASAEPLGAWRQGADELCSASAPNEYVALTEAEVSAMALAKENLAPPMFPLGALDPAHTRVPPSRKPFSLRAILDIKTQFAAAAAAVSERPLVPVLTPSTDVSHAQVRSLCEQ